MVSVLRFENFAVGELADYFFNEIDIVATLLYTF